MRAVVAAALLASVPAVGWPTYQVNFSTDASSAMPGYSMPGLLPQYSVPGGDILGLFQSPGGMVVPPGTGNRPAILCPAGPGGFGMGFTALPPCVEVDAYSTGADWEGMPWPWVIIFSVDRTSTGFPWQRHPAVAAYSDVSGEAAANDAAADMFVSGVYLRVVTRGGQRYLQIGTPAWNYLGFDGNGLAGLGPAPAAACARTPLGLMEPSPPGGGGDDVDGIDSVGATKTFEFLSPRLMSPAYPHIPVLGTGSRLQRGLFFSLDVPCAQSYGCSPADILCTNDGVQPWVWASAAQLGLDPVRDDIDALAIRSYAGWPAGTRYNPLGDFVVFSVSRNSAIVGTPDVLYGIPIMPSDLLMPADILGFPGRIAILVPSSGMGLLPFLQRPQGVVTDNLNALHAYGVPQFPGQGECEGIEWDTFSLCGNAAAWLPEDAISEWDERGIAEAIPLPDGPFPPPRSPGGGFRRGDGNADGATDIGDAVALLGYLFGDGQGPSCEDAGDANDDGRIDLADAIKILGYLFRSEGPLPAPFADCGPDPTADDLGCDSFPPCL